MSLEANRPVFNHKNHRMKRSIGGKKPPKHRAKSPEAVFGYDELKRQSDEVFGKPGKYKTTDPGKRKVSDILLEFSEPLRQGDPPFEVEKSIIGFCILVWNISLIPQNEQEQQINRMLKELGVLGEKDEKGFREDIRMLMDRKKWFFPEYKMFIVSWHVGESADGLHLSVSYNEADY